MTNAEHIRDAATAIVVRNPTTNPEVLMGQRGATAAFLPNKFVFPGGAVEAEDAAVDAPLSPRETTLLAQDSHLAPATLAATAIRELFEETGQILGQKGTWKDPPQNWRGFASTGHVPLSQTLEFVFRAVTPQGRPRRFDARFFLVDAAHLASDPDDFTRADAELSHLHWVALPQARQLDLPFITKIVLAEITARLSGQPRKTVPFFKNADAAHHVTQLALPNDA